jgi:hypothetical protein
MVGARAIAVVKWSNALNVMLSFPRSLLWWIMYRKFMKEAVIDLLQKLQLMCVLSVVKDSETLCPLWSMLREIMAAVRVESIGIKLILN